MTASKPPLSASSSVRTLPVEIAPGTWWVGRREPGHIFYANPYLRVFKGTDPKQNRQVEFRLLIDPGSSADFSTVSSKVTAVSGSMEKISAIFYNHQDPDLTSSSAMITGRFAPKAAIICSEDTWRLIVHYNLPRARFVATDKFASGLQLPTGHKVLPVPSPFCHFRGAVMLYDPETRVLFTGDLFGGLTDANAQGIYADESDWNGIRAFHQIYMPSNAALARAVQTIRRLDPPVEIIAPQHGRIIKGPLVETFLNRMERLPVGMDIIDESSDPSVLQAWRSVLERVMAMAGGYLGSAVHAKLATLEDLDGAATFENGEVKVHRLGKWVVERVVQTLCDGEPDELAGPIQYEAVYAAAEYGLPTPHIDLERGDEMVHVSSLLY